MKRKRRRAGAARTRQLRRVLLAIVALGATGLAIVAYETNLLRSLELSTVNTRFTIRGRQRPPANIVLVEIDERTFDELDLQWPFPRRVHAKVIEDIARDHPKAIAYDVQFSEASACPLSTKGTQPPPGECPQAQQRRDRAARSARQRRRAHRDDHHRNRRQREDEVPRQRRQRAAGRSGVAAGQRAAADRSGRRPAARQLLGRRAEDARGGERGSRRPGIGCARASSTEVPPGSTTTGRKTASAACRSRRSISAMCRAASSTTRSWSSAPRRRRCRTSTRPPPPGRCRSRSPGERDRDGAAGPAAALLGGMAGSGADRAAGLRHAARHAAVRLDRHRRAGAGARGGVHGRRAGRLRQRARRVVRLPARGADPQRGGGAVGAAGDGRLRARAGTRPVLALRARERRRRGAGERGWGTAPRRGAARGNRDVHRPARLHLVRGNADARTA